MTKAKFSFGSNPKMREVPPGTEAILSFNGEPELVETKYGPKIQCPITLYSHDSYPILKDGPLDMEWVSKSSCATQLFEALAKTNESKFTKELKEHYKKSKWQLTRFDTGVYFISVLK